MTCNKCNALQKIIIQQDKDYFEWNKKKLELQADNNRLREALEEISNWKFGWDGDCGVTAVAEQALTTAPAQSLQSVINETIDKALNCYSPDDTADDYMDKIRALKGSK